jgi:hypothetical protein
LSVLATLIKECGVNGALECESYKHFDRIFQPRTTTIVTRRECHIFTLLIHFTCGRITHRCLTVIIEFSVANLLKLVLGKYVSQKKMPK